MKQLFLLTLSLAALFSCSMSVIEVRSKGVVLKDNVVVHYLEAGQGPVLVLLHGLGGSANAWRGDIGLLASSYRVIALDLPGYGKSDKPSADHSVECQARAVRECIESLGPGKVALAGHSLGGWIAALVALDYPDKISHLILVDSAGLHSGSDPQPALRNPASRGEQKELLLSFYADKSKVTESLVDAQWEYRKEIRPTVQSAIESFQTTTSFLDDRLKDITVPTLIVWGKQDALLPLETAAKFVQGIHGAKLVVIDHAGHLPHVEQPKAFSRAIKGFVRSW